MSRGRPFEPGNQCGRGRPKGSPNKKTAIARKLLEEHAPAIMALAINRSREDRQILKMFASHIIGQPRNAPVKIGRLPMKSFADLDRASETLLEKAASGKISPSDARDISSIIDHRRSILVAQNLDRRLTALEHPDEQERAA